VSVSLRCFFGRHAYVVARQINPGTRKVACMRCERTWAMHDATRTFVPWDSEIEAMYDDGGPLDPRTDQRYGGRA